MITDYEGNSAAAIIGNYDSKNHIFQKKTFSKRKCECYNTNYLFVTGYCVQNPNPKKTNWKFS